MMNPKVEINTLSISKLKNEFVSFVKYDIEASIDELENTETEIKLKYRFGLLSNPTNTKISVEGIATLYGAQSETSKYLVADEKNIPSVVNRIYQEIFPLFFVISKSMQIPCPAFKLSEFSTTQLGTPSIQEKMESQSNLAVEKIIQPETLAIENPEIEAEQRIQEQIIKT